MTTNTTLRPLDAADIEWLDEDEIPTPQSESSGFFDTFSKVRIGDLIMQLLLMNHLPNHYEDQPSAAEESAIKAAHTEIFAKTGKRIYVEEDPNPHRITPTKAGNNGRNGMWITFSALIPVFEGTDPTGEKVFDERLFDALTEMFDVFHQYRDELRIKLTRDDADFTISGSVADIYYMLLNMHADEVFSMLGDNHLSHITAETQTMETEDGGPVEVVMDDGATEIFRRDDRYEDAIAALHTNPIVGNDGKIIDPLMVMESGSKLNHFRNAAIAHTLASLRKIGEYQKTCDAADGLDPASYVQQIPYRAFTSHGAAIAAMAINLEEEHMPMTMHELAALLKTEGHIKDTRLLPMPGGMRMN